MDETDLFFKDCLDGQAEVVADKLRRDGGLVHARRIGGRTPLHQAAFGGSEEVARLLIDHGADVNAKSEYGMVPLHYAAAPLCEKTGALLIASGADVNVPNDTGVTPLHLAADCGKDSLMRLLIAGGADVNARDKDGRTPLDYASEDMATAQLLKDRGATSGSGPLVAEPLTIPDWLVGHEDDLQKLFDLAGDSWRVKGNDADEDDPKQS